MAIFAIGDVQGCFLTLLRLTERIGFDPDHDRIWLAGDLVNRGPRSAEVLRWVKEQGPAVTAVMGNHDLHLLARAEGLAGPKRRDTLDDVLDAKDRSQLLDTVRSLHLIHEEGEHVMVHAGFHPTWDLETSKQRAKQAEEALSSEPRAFLEATRYRTDSPRLSPPWSDIRRNVSIITRIRMVKPNAEPWFNFARTPEEAPEGYLPWFEVPKRPPFGRTILFGHWAALGLRKGPDFMCLDTGCVWGQVLTAVRLEDGAVFQEPYAD